MMTYLLPESRFDDNTAKSRYGVAYLRSICGQAGVGFVETSSDEDKDAIDCQVSLGPSHVYVQVKCSDKFRIDGGATATWPAEQHWRERWRSKANPVYFILVLVDKVDRVKWLEHPDDGTFHRSAAFWTMVNAIADDENIVIDKANRFTVQTLCDWEVDLRRRFRPIGGG